MTTSDQTREAVYDVRAPERNPWLIAPPAFGRAYCAWLCAHGIDPGLTYRTEHHLVDAPFIRVFTRDPAGGADNTPHNVLITSPAPRPEDYA